MDALSASPFSEREGKHIRQIGSVGSAVLFELEHERFRFRRRQLERFARLALRRLFELYESLPVLGMPAMHPSDAIPVQRVQHAIEPRPQLVRNALGLVCLDVGIVQERLPIISGEFLGIAFERSERCI